MKENPPVAPDIVDELHRRKVLRTTTIYAVVGWCLLQLSTIYFPQLGLPAWAVTLVLTVVILGFPAVVALSWVFDVTARGIERTQGGAPQSGQPARVNRMVDALVILLLVITVTLLLRQVS